VKALGRSHLITPASETDPKTLGNVLLCHTEEERTMFVSGQTCLVGMNFVYMFPVRHTLSLLGSSVETEEFNTVLTAVQ